MNIKNILLVDDDEDDRMLFIDAIREINTDVACEEASNGIEALQTLNNLQPLPDVIFLDLNMPMMNGYECLSKIKSEVKLRHIPVVIFTTSRFAAEKQRVLNMGANSFFSKPSDFNGLQQELKKIIGEIAGPNEEQQ